MKAEHSILLVEDSADDVMLIERAMQKSGFAAPMNVVGDGDLAVRYLAGEEKYADRIAYPLPTLVLLDLKLPRRSGFEVLSWIRQNDPTRSLIVVVLTGSKESKDIQNAYAAGANSYLVKPISPNSMNELVKTLGLYWLQLNEPPQAKAG